MWIQIHLHTNKKEYCALCLYLGLGKRPLIRIYTNIHRNARAKMYKITQSLKHTHAHTYIHSRIQTQHTNPPTKRKHAHASKHIGISTQTNKHCVHTPLPLQATSHAPRPGRIFRQDSLGESRSTDRAANVCVPALTSRTVTREAGSRVGDGGREG